MRGDDRGLSERIWLRLSGAGAVAPSRALPLVLVVCFLFAVFPAGVGASPGGDQAKVAAVTVSMTSATQRVPPSFLGLGVEYNELPIYENAASLFDRFISLVRPQDGSHLLLRLGGRSADDAFWKTTPTHVPHWVFEIGDDWMSRLAGLVSREHLGVMLDVNLAVHSPTMAAAFAQAAVAALPAGHLKGLGIGNEPDLYSEQLGLEQERTSTTLASTPSNWAESYASAQYRSDYATYARALIRAAPGVPLDGPDSTSSNSNWVAAVAGLGQLGPSQITMHRYPFSSCFPPSSPFYPTIPGLLTQAASGGLATRLQGALQIAAEHALPLRVTEINSMSCGGPPGIANSFATALWTPDALFELMRAGIAGINWHIRPELRNAPFHLGRQGFVAEPELYGLAMFTDMLGPRARLVGVQVPASASELKVWAVRSRTGLRVLLINKGSNPLHVQLPRSASSGHTAGVMRLIAPGLQAQTGVTLAGQTLGSDARWHGRRVIVKVRARRGSYSLTLAGYSAELVKLAA